MINPLPLDFYEKLPNLDPQRVNKALPKSKRGDAPKTTEAQVFSMLIGGAWKEAGFDSQSEADLRLCGILAKTCCGDRQLVDQMFRRSRLMRSKWDEKHGEKTYGEATLDKALRGKEAAPVEISEEYLDQEFPALCDAVIPPVEVIVDQLLIKGGIVCVAGMFESFKTMWMMEWASAIIDKRPLSDHFAVFKSYPVIGCCPDMDAALLKEYATPFGLASKEVGKRFRIMHPQGDAVHAVDSPVMQKLVNGHILILDTMWDFAQIQKAFESGEWIAFFQKLRRLINQFGCVAIVMLAHPTKSGARSTSIEPAEFLKDSVTFGGKLDAAFACSRLDDKPAEPPQIFVQRIKGRGFRGPMTFTIKTQSEDGKTNYLDRGRFPVHLPPGEAGKKGDHVEKRGRKADEQRDDKIDFLMGLETLGTMNYLDMTEAMNKKFNGSHTVNTTKTWLKRGRQEKQRHLSLAAEAMNTVLSAGKEKAESLGLTDRDIEFDTQKLEGKK